MCRTSDRDIPQDGVLETSSAAQIICGLQRNPGGRPLRVYDSMFQPTTVSRDTPTDAPARPEALFQTQIVSQSEGLDTASKPSL